MKRINLLKVFVVLAGSFLLSAPNAWATVCSADTNCNGKVDGPDIFIIVSEANASLRNCDPSTQCKNCEASGMLDCGGTCVDNSTDENNCGSCGNTCASSEMCIDGACAITRCEGTLSALGRWCDQGDGTVKDMTNGIVWLKDADWGAAYAFWVDTMQGTNAHDRAAQLWDGSPYEGTAGLSDGSVEGDWRLPTKTELYNLANGTEAVRTTGSMQLFTGLQGFYWSSTSYASDPDYAWVVYMHNGSANYANKYISYYVWPVRPDN